MLETGVSLICATRGRTLEVARLLKSLNCQTQKTFELILVDQNHDNRVSEIVNQHGKAIAITHMRLGDVGLARARNAAIAMARYSWVGFPDDDCWCPPDFIRCLCEACQRYQASDGIFINWVDPGHPDRKPFQFKNGKMTFDEGFKLVSSICLYIRKDLLMVTSGFNEKFGLGPNSVVKAGEDQELTLRLLSQEAHIEKIAELMIYHPIDHRAWDAQFLKRIQSQGACDIYFQRAYRGTVHAWKTIFFWIAAAGFNALRFNRKNLQWYSHKLYGAIIYGHRLR